MFFLALKTGLATAVALGLDALTGNPDHVSSTFIAVVCVSPVVLMGLRRSRDQVIGSLIGGGAGTLLAAAGAPPELGIPLAVGFGVLICFLAGFGEGYLLSSFAALFVQAVPFGDPLETLGIRGLAVITGAFSGLVINVAVSAFAYRSIFTRRLASAEAEVEELLVRVVHEGPEAVHGGFPRIWNLCQETDLAHRELLWRGEDLAWLASVRGRLQDLRRLLHLIADLDDLRRTTEVSSDRVTSWLGDRLRGEDPAPLPAAFESTTDRLSEVIDRLDLRLPRRLGG